MSQEDKNNKEKVTVLHKHERPKRTNKKPSHGETQRRKEAARRAKKEASNEKLKNHRFWIVRAGYKLANGIWIVVMAIGGFIAWLLGTLFV